MQLQLKVILLGSFMVLFAACSGGTPAQSIAATTQTPTETPLPKPTAAIVEEVVNPTPTPASTNTLAPTSEPEPTEMAMEEPPEEAPAVAEDIDWLAVEGKTDDNLTYLGNPNAPITIIDYSDFM